MTMTRIGVLEYSSLYLNLDIFHKGGSIRDNFIQVSSIFFQILCLSLEGTTAGMSPDPNIQSHSLPSSVTDTLEAMVGGGLDDLTLEDIDPTNLTEEQAEVC